ncbi:GntR family transcriptional regulator [Nocardia sp. NPDC127606]|uniref:GntR family transcriptional regulator n=1 Tax=Nocardia sp. NPDC127606 TaxID=3345406 RepID=UPI00362FC04E
MDIDRSGLAAYQRVAEQIKQDIRDGRLAPGARLPGNRQIAEDYAVALGTAQKALQYLRENGWVTVTPAVGVFVAEECPPEGGVTDIEAMRVELRKLQAETADLSARVERLEADAEGS